MKKLKTLNLWFAFVGTVFFILLTTSIVTIIITFFMLHSGWIRITGPIHFPPVPIMMFLVASIAIGTAITLFVGRKVLKPISDFSLATTHVAKGDFNVRLSYEGRVDELREMVTNFNIMVTELGSIETLRNDFVVTVSHEFKTPLASIEGYAKMLQNPAITPEERLEYTQIITKSTKQLSSLASNILKISNLESQEIIRDKTAFRLDEQIRQALLLLETQWENKKLNLNINLEPANFKGSEELLMQVWLNLLGNAIKFTPKNGEITVSLDVNPTQIRVIISDTGIGISTTAQKHIFDKFYQADSSGFTEGNGLGLALVKRILDLCQYEIKVESQLGAGSTFFVILTI